MKEIFKHKKQSIKVGDTVKIITGNDKTKTGKVKAVRKGDQKIIVQGINKKFLHLKPKQQGEVGKIKTFFAPIHISNLKKLEN
uniref:ribosomal protein L24 n=1 Tax=Vacuolaria virescens TaxID=44451 RepID=UPI0021140BC7|nr:ribosomal protein L24 [Vacuolaria virescens]UTE94631.1 ribosomal protein L24 [Vacuolaria virescens]